MESTPARVATPRQFEMFRAVMLAGGVSSAARLLNTSQPAVSYQLRMLEEALGFALFERVRGRLVPTHEGKALSIEVNRHFVGMEEIARAAAHLRGQEVNQLNVGALPALAFTVMPKVVARFRESFPSVKVSLQTVSSSVIKDAVATGQFDVGFVASEVETVGVRSSEFTSQAAVAVVPVGHRFATKSWLQPKDLKEQPLIALNPEDATRLPVDEALRKQGVAPRVVAETPYALGVCALVEAGVGIGLVNPLAVPDAYLSTLSVIRFRPEIRFRHLLLLPPHQPQGRTVRGFIAMARAVVAECAAGPSMRRPRS